jgi:hypothetical protein
MSLQYCKVGKTKPLSAESIDLGLLKKKHSIVIEEAYNLRQTDSSLSDILYFEAKRLKRHIVNLKNKLTKNLDVSL